MPRRKCCRRVACEPRCNVFKPAGIPGRDLERVAMTVDEFEAIRLADFEGLYQEQAAEQMAVSRQTFGRIVTAAHRKVAEALIKGKALHIEGGEIEMQEMRTFTCHNCKHEWQIPYGTGRPEACPECGGTNIHRAASEQGDSAGAGRGKGLGCAQGRGQGRRGAGGSGQGGGRGNPGRGRGGASNN